MQLMDLVDLEGAITTEVPIGRDKSKTLTIRGLSVSDIIYLIQTYPEIAALLEGRVKDVTPAAITSMAPRVLGDVIACACEQRANEKAIAWASRLSIGRQRDVVEAIFELTFPEGFIPFVEKMMALQEGFANSSSLLTPGHNGASPAASSSSVSAALQLDTEAAKFYRPRRVKSRRGTRQRSAVG